MDSNSKLGISISLGIALIAILVAVTTASTVTNNQSDVLAQADDDDFQTNSHSLSNETTNGLDVARIENGKFISLYPEDECTSIHLTRLASTALLEGPDVEIEILELREEDFVKVPELKELIMATHLVDFSLNNDASIELSILELLDYEYNLMEKSIQ